MIYIAENLDWTLYTHVKAPLPFLCVLKLEELQDNFSIENFYCIKLVHMNCKTYMGTCRKCTITEFLLLMLNFLFWPAWWSFPK